MDLVVARNFGWDAHGYDAPSALRRAAELFEGPLSEAREIFHGFSHQNLSIDAFLCFPQAVYCCAS